MKKKKIIGIARQKGSWCFGAVLQTDDCLQKDVILGWPLVVPGPFSKKLTIFSFTGVLSWQM